MDNTFTKKFDQILRSDSQRAALVGVLVGLVNLDPNEMSFEAVQHALVETLIHIMEELPVDDNMDKALNDALNEKSGIMKEVFSIINP